MSFAAGARLGHYEILSSLGAGGMGEVYRARDTELDRDVALKVLPESFATDPDRLMRFTREAKTLASLNHPNIAAIYGIESQAPLDGARGAVSVSRTALVMELIDGEDLSERIRRGPLELEEAVGIAKQIADALEAAHESGIIHRDLKPANIKVRADGTVKVLDFGLAKAMDGGNAGAKDPASGAASSTPSNSPTMTSPAQTAMGLILGTAAYMAPEQARGKPVDKRADIWAFGVVLYEMLTGATLFAGETVSDVMAAVLRADIDLAKLPSSVPPAIRRLLSRCLEKDPRRRLRDIGDARPELSELAAPPVRMLPAPARASSSRWVAVMVLAALVIGAIGGVMWRASRDEVPVEWTGARLGGPAIALYPRISPDSQFLAFHAMVDGLTQIAVMKPGTGNWTVLTHDRTHGLANALAWAPDGARVYYDRVTDVPLGIFSVPALGGAERLLIENASAPEPLPDGSLLLQRINADRQPQLHRFWPDTGKLEPLPVITSRSGFAGPVRRVDADRVAVIGRPVANVAGQDELHLLTLSTGALTSLGLRWSSDAIFSTTVRPNDQAILVSVRDGSAYRVIEVRADGKVPPKSLMTFLSRPFIDAATDGTLFMALLDRPTEIVHFREGHAVADRWLGGPTLFRPAVGLPDGRFLIPERLHDSTHMLVGAPGKESVRLVETTEDTRPPMTPIGTDRVALIIGNATPPDIGVVAVNSGRILKRLKAPDAITAMAASPDGTVLYVAAGGTIIGLPIDGGAPRTLGSGDSLTVDPDTGDLIVKLDEVNGYRLVRMSPGGGAPKPITIDGPLKMVAEPLIAGAVRNGRLLLPVTTLDSWYWFPGVLDLRTGKLQRITLDYFTDFHFVTWASDGSIIGSANGTDSTLWRFSPEPSRK